MGPAFADTHYVATNGAHVSPFTNWATAARAISNAVAMASNGDEVLVSNGTYAIAAPIRVTNGITVRGLNGAFNTVVNGSQTTRCFVVQHAQAVLDGLNIVNGSTWAGDPGGAGVYLAGGTVQNCRLSNNFAVASGDGGGIHIAYDGMVSNCLLARNAAGLSGRNAGGVYVGAGGTVTHCTITNSYSSFSGGGLYVDTGGTVEHCTIVGNECEIGGGGAYINTNGTVRDCVIHRNKTDTNKGSGGGVYGVDGAIIASCTITSNEAEYGAGLFATGNVTVADCTISSNSAMGWSSGYGGGAYLADTGTMERCTIQKNHARYEGGGVWGSGGAVIRDCTIVGNSAGITTQIGDGGGVCFQDSGFLINCTVVSNVSNYRGGGASGGVLRNSVFWGNTARNGGGTYYSTLNNCTLSGNSADYGGGAYRGTLNNCVVYYNAGLIGLNTYESELSYSCTTPDPSGLRNVASAPQLLSVHYIAAGSPCATAGSMEYASGTDVDGESWSTPPAMGCDEPTRPATGTLSVAIRALTTNIATNCSAPFLTACIQGVPVSNTWSFGDGGAVTNQSFDVAHAWAATGVFDVIVTAWNDSNPGGVAATVQVRVVSGTHYASRSNATPAAPYDTWSKAATNIQDALDAAPFGGLVFVSNGIYNTGGRPAPGLVRTNRVMVPMAVTLRSMNGPTDTVIRGSGTPGPTGVRGAYLSAGAVLTGFTVTNGATGMDLYRGSADIDGGGVWGQAAVVSNCIISGNSAYENGGGTARGTLYNCTLTGNSAPHGGGVSFGALFDCALTGNSSSFGGAASDSELRNCTLVGNSASYGGGADHCRLYGCTLSGNSALYEGGGAQFGALHNCTLTGNSAARKGGGTYFGTLYNCIVYYNAATSNGTENYYGSSLDHCCTTPAAPGTNNIDDDPQFVGAASNDYRLLAGSPCIDSGINQGWMATASDLGSNPRVFNKTVDMGAYEFTMSTDLKTFLQGPYSTNLHRMTTALSDNHLVPLSAPYASDPQAVGTIPTNVTDWVLAQLLSTNDFSSVAAKSAFLRRDGQAIRDDGTTGIRLEASPGYYYVAIQHRNHCGVMSANPVAFTNSLVSYDFTTGSDKYYGGTNGAVLVGSGVWGLIAGDADGDGKITATDRAICSNQVGKTGYLSGDFNLDGQVTGNE